MKFFFYIKSLAAGGAETQSTIIASGLKRTGVDVGFIVYSKARANTKNIERLTNANIPIFELCWKRPHDLWKMYQLFRANRGGALFAFTSFPNFIGGCVAKLAGLKHIYAGIRSENLPPLHMKMERFLNRFIVKKTIFNSYRGRENFISLGFNPEKSITISNAIEPLHLAIPMSNPKSAAIKIVTVGRFISTKDYYTWLKVIAKVHEVISNIKAMIIGYGELENEIHEWIHELHLADIVVLKRGNGGIDIDTELASSDIYFTTTLREGCCNTILEAMRAGLPVVATNVGDNAYMIKDGINGFISPIKDVEKMTNDILYLIGNANVRNKFGIESMNTVVAAYSPDAVFAQYREIIKEII